MHAFRISMTCKSAAGFVYALLASIPATTLRDLRDRALIATLT